ncbi:MAG: peptidoglycan-associated lipoprotein Pal [Desulfohalobiaceae bacterium]
MSQGCRMFWVLGFLLFSGLLLAGCAQKEVSTEAEAEQEKGWRAEAEQEEQGLTESELDQDLQDAEEMDEFKIQEEDRRKARAEQEEAEKDQEVDQEIKQQLQKRIHFAFDSYDLRSEAREILREKAELLQENQNLQMVIEGHCDERGTAEYNLALGERRARAAYEFLVLLGVDADRLSIISYGEERPLEEGSNEEAWSENRRAEFRVYK